MTREKAIKILKDLSDCSYIGSLASEDIEALKMAIEALEQEPRKGKWIDTNTFDAKYKAIYMCSNCRSYYTEMKPTNMNFCPNCGAKMESEEK